jgi:hypothetical protein
MPSISSGERIPVRAARSAFVALVVLAVGWRASPALAMPRLPLHKSSKPLLLLGSFGTAAPKGQEEFFSLVLSRALLGARAGTRALDGKTRFSEVISSDQVAADERDARFLREIGPRYGRDMQTEIIAIQTLRHTPVGGYLRLGIREFEQEIRVDLELYEPGVKDEGFAVRRMKTARGTPSDRQGLLDLVVDAARRIVEDQRGNPDDDKRPIALATVQPAAVVSVGTHVTLDASPSVDPDHDTVLWFWCQASGPPHASRVLPKAWVGRRRIDFAPTEEGEYRFVLKVSEALDVDAEDGDCAGKADDASLQVFTVKARKAPVAIAGESQLVQIDPVKPEQVKALHDQPPRIMLEGECRYCTEYRWRQIKGPSVAIWAPTGQRRCDHEWLATVPATTDGPADARCRFDDTLPGEYVFELVARTELAEDVRRVTVLVAPRPFVILSALKVDTLVGEPLALEASASYDLLDPNPVLRWEALDAPPSQDECRPSDSYRHGGWITSSKGGRADFVARTPGAYYARLVVGAHRSLAGQELLSYSCSSVPITVHPRLWALSMTFGFVMAETLSNGGLADQFTELRGTAHRMFDWWVWGGRLGIRFEQAIYGYRMEARGAVPPGGSFGGAATISGSYTIELSPTLQLRGHLGGFGQFSSEHHRIRRIGPEIGAEGLLEMAHGWGVIGTASARLFASHETLMNVTHDNTYLEWRLSGGPIFQF